MNTVSKNKIVNVKKIVGVLVAITICFTILPGFRTEAQANDGTAFLGGILAGRVLSVAGERSKQRTMAAESMAYSKQQEAQSAAHAPAPAPVAKKTPEERIKELDKLAAGGYITPEEYKAQKKVILDSI